MYGQTHHNIHHSSIQYIQSTELLVLGRIIDYCVAIIVHRSQQDKNATTITTTTTKKEERLI